MSKIITAAPEDEPHQRPSPKDPGRILVYAYDITLDDESKKTFEFFVVEADGGSLFYLNEGIGMDYFLADIAHISEEGLWLITDITVSYTRGDGWEIDDDEDWEFAEPVKVSLNDLPRSTRS